MLKVSKLNFHFSLNYIFKMLFLFTEICSKSWKLE